MCSHKPQCILGIADNALNRVYREAVRMVEKFPGCAIKFGSAGLGGDPNGFTIDINIAEGEKGWELETLDLKILSMEIPCCEHDTKQQGD